MHECPECSSFTLHIVKKSCYCTTCCFTIDNKHVRIHSLKNKEITLTKHLNRLNFSIKERNKINIIFRDFHYFLKKYDGKNVKYKSFLYYILKALDIPNDLKPVHSHIMETYMNDLRKIYYESYLENDCLKNRYLTIDEIKNY